ncbi:MAG: glutathione S-transferase family protein [Chromatiales bacterium]|jgi:glutathione S-transferase|nr:glutathione S-transferase family protein [Chromatiales bacterium]
MLKIWGRNDGSNVVKVMWCVGELGIAHTRIDWGGPFGGNDDPAYRAKNPNGRLPTIEYDDGYTLWESGAVIRFLCAEHSLGDLCPADNRTRAAAEKWMDWSSLNFAGFNSVLLAQYFTLPEEKRTPGAVEAVVKQYSPALDILEKHLDSQPYLNGDAMTMADIPAGSLVHRWFHWLQTPPTHPNVRAWYERLAARPEYQTHVVEANRSRTETVPWRQ